MKKFITTILLVTVCTVGFSQMAQFQALYIYNFAKNISWPKEDANKNFVITVIGDNDLTIELNKLAKTKGIGSRKVIVNQVATSVDLPKSDIIFLGESKSGQINVLIKSQQNSKTLIVSGKKGQCTNGAGISFVSEGGKLNFEISSNNINNHGLLVSQKLISLGTIIN